MVINNNNFIYNKIRKEVINMMKGRIFVTGDCHGNLTRIIDFIHKFDLKLGDSIIVLGDMGLFWRNDQKDAEYNIKYYEDNCNGVHLYWLDGNHENFDIINSWNKNKNYTYDNSDHIHYCPRGFETFIDIDCGDHIEARKALFIGGADSVDKMWRTKHLSWWEDEKITEDDIKDIKGSYYYVFSHCCPKSIFDTNKVYLCTLANINENNAIHQSENKLEELKNNILYEKWFFAHYHIDRKLDDKHMCLFEDFIELK